jgi:hypothetical protein
VSSEPGAGHFTEPVESNETAPTEATPKVDPELAALRMTMLSQVYTGRARSEHISDNEFPVGLRDMTTDNYRKSLEAASKPRVPPTNENEVNPFDDHAVAAALARQQFRVVK